MAGRGGMVDTSGLNPDGDSRAGSIPAAPKHTLCRGKVRYRHCIECGQTFGNDIKNWHIRRRDFDPSLAGKAAHCGKKRAYVYRVDALKHMDNLGPDPSLSVYICDFCGKWHVGHRRSLRAAEPVK